MANEDKALNKQQKPEISLNKPNSPTVIGNHTKVVIHQYPPGIFLIKLRHLIKTPLPDDATPETQSSNNIYF